MPHFTNWIGIDDHADKLTIALYVGTQKQPAKVWEVAPTEAGLRQLLRWIKELDGPVHCVYEAGPCGYELYRLLVSKKIDCAVAAPSLTPRKPGERIKTNRRDTRKLGELHRAGMLTLITVPDRRQESIRCCGRAPTYARAFSVRDTASASSFCGRAAAIATARRGNRPTGSGSGRRR